MIRKWRSPDVGWLVAVLKLMPQTAKVTVEWDTDEDGKPIYWTDVVGLGDYETGRMIFEPDTDHFDVQETVDDCTCDILWFTKPTVTELVTFLAGGDQGDTVGFADTDQEPHPVCDVEVREGVDGTVSIIFDGLGEGAKLGCRCAHCDADKVAMTRP